MNYKVLFLASWYPSRVQPVSGIFIEKHAQAVAGFCNVAVLYVTKDPSLFKKKYDIEYSVDNDIPTVRVFYQPPPQIPIILDIIKLFRYIMGGFLGLKIIREKFGRPDIVQVNVALPAGILAFFMKKIKGIPYIISENWSFYSRPNDGYKEDFFFNKLITKITFRNAEVVTAVSQYLLDALKRYKLVAGKSMIVPNTVDIPQAINLKRNNPKIKILTVSLLTDKVKNVSGLIRAFSKVLDKYKGVELHIIGDGIDRNKLECLAENLGLLNKNIFFHGFVSNKEIRNKYLPEANFFVLNSNYENHSVATTEAIACGIPIVATKCGAQGELVKEEVGILVEKQNEESLTRGIEYMIENYSRYNPEKLHQYAKDKFSPPVVGQMFCRIYRDLKRH